MTEVRLYVEGGGSSREFQARCREGVRKLLENCGLQGHMPRIIACGGRKEAYDDFCVAAKQKNIGAVFLLVDSEDPVADIDKPWDHLKARQGDGWDRPTGADDAQVLLMATCMETWIAADRAGLKRLYGNCLQENALPPLHKLESRHRHDVFDKLKQATKTCKPPFDKGEPSFKALANADPAVLREHLPSFARAERLLREKLQPQIHESTDEDLA